MINIWLFGDSFSTEGHLGKALRDKLTTTSHSRIDKEPATDSIYNIGNRQYAIRNYSGGSMDMQTIIDFWTKNLIKIKENDIVIVNLTESSRSRLSLIDKHIYTGPHHPHESEYEEKSYFNYINNGHMISNIMIEAIKEMNLSDKNYENYINITTYDRMQKAIILNYFEIVENLYKLTNTKNKFVWCWNEQYISDFIYDKNRIINEITGYWETQNDVYLKTNGQSGFREDSHLSDGCNTSLANYLYKRFIDGTI